MYSNLSVIFVAKYLSLVSLFKEKSAVSVFLLILLSAVVHVSFLFNAPAVVVTAKDGLIDFLMTPMKNWTPVFLSFLYHLIVIVQALRLNYLLQSRKMLPQGYLPAMVYILFTGLYPLWNNITPGLFINFLIIWMFSLCLRLSHRDDKNGIVFNIGFVAGLCALLYIPSFMLVLIMLIGIFTFTTFTLKTFLIYLLAVILPLYFAVSVFYLTDMLPLAMKYIPDFGWQIPQFKDSRELIIAFSVLVSMVVLGLMKTPYANMLIVARKGWSLMLTALVLLSAGIVFLEDHSLETLIIIAVPAAGISSNFFIYNRSKIVSALFFWVIILACWYVGWGKFILK